MLARGHANKEKVRVLALIIRLSRRPHLYLNREELHRRLANTFRASFFKNMYSTLLRQGRIWDFHDMLTSLLYIQNINDIMENLFDGADVRQGLRTMITDWETATYDSSTALALLGIFAYILIDYLYSFKGQDQMIEGCLSQSLPLARSIMKNDSQGMKSHQFIRWLLAKAMVSCPGSFVYLGLLVEVTA
jgi:hypothetical protein